MSQRYRLDCRFYESDWSTMCESNDLKTIGRKAILVSRQQGHLVRLIDTLIGRPIFLSDLEKEN